MTESSHRATQPERTAMSSVAPAPAPAYEPPGRWRAAEQRQRFADLAATVVTPERFGPNAAGRPAGAPRGWPY